MSGFKRNEEKKKITLNEEFIFFFPVAHAEALFFRTQKLTQSLSFLVSHLNNQTVEV